MICISLLMLCVQLSVIYSAPIQLQSLQPVQNLLSMHSQQSLQQQMIALQHLQQLQELLRLNVLQTPIMPNPTRPLVILLPNAQESNIQANTKTMINNRFENLSEIEHKQSNHGIHEIEDDESDSIIIDAEDTMKIQPKRAILLVPSNGKFSIGGFISSIPFLPFEINVPDSISWIYNGIAGIIGGIGQRLPFRPQNSAQDQGQDQANMRINLDNIQRINNGLPILVMPLGVPLLPIQV